MGLTWHDAPSVPGTVIRVARRGRLVWFREDDPKQQQWLHRAIHMPDGCWREDFELRLVTLGTREAVELPLHPALPSHEQSFRVRAAQFEAGLLRKRSYPMTYLMIPSMLTQVDVLIAEFSPKAPVLAAHLKSLRAGFRRSA
jgi:hypothetical protein